MKRLELLAGLCLLQWYRSPRRSSPESCTWFHPTHPVSAITEHAGLRTLFVELRRLGYEDGRNVTVERSTAIASCGR
jgi:hypothetical protein